MERKIDYLFCITSGRSGSGYLSELWKRLAPESSCAIVEHEPLPVCCGAPMRQWNEGDSAAMRELVRRKKAAVDAQREAARDSTGRAALYVESNAQFIKGFGWEWLRQTPAAERGRLGVVHLTRDRAAAADSFLANAEAPGFDCFADVWNIRPGCLRSVTAAPETGLTPGQAVAWQLEEVDARAAAFRALYPSVPCFSVDLQQLNSHETVLQMFAFFGLPIPDASRSSLSAVVSRPVNTGHERFHRPASEHSSSPLRPFSLLPSDPFLQAKLVEASAAFVVQRAGAADIAAVRRAILGMPDCISCMVGAKSALNAHHHALAAELLSGCEFNFTDFRWNLICQIVKSADPFDPMFRFVSEIAPFRFRLDGLNQISTTSIQHSTSTSTQHSTSTQQFTSSSSPWLDGILLSHSDPLVVTVSGTNGRVGQMLIPHLIMELRKHIPADRWIELRLLARANPQSQMKASGLVFDLEDGHFTDSLCCRAEVFSDPELAFAGCHLAVLMASAPRLEHYARIHLTPMQTDTYCRHARAIATTASPSAQILVVANPVVTLVRVMLTACPQLAGRVTGMCSVDEARAAALLLRKGNQQASLGAVGEWPRWTRVQGLQVLGNHSDHVWIDVSNAVMISEPSGHCVPVIDMFPRDFLRCDLQQHVRSRGGVVIQALQQTSTHATITGIISHIRTLLRRPISVSSSLSDSTGPNSIIRDCTSLFPFTFTDSEFPPFSKCFDIPALWASALPCSRNLSPCLLSLARALAWSPDAVASMKQSAEELEQEWCASGYEASLPVLLPLGPQLHLRLHRIRSLLQSTDALVIYAGAGMSCAAGIPDIVDFDRAFPSLPSRGITNIFQASNHSLFLKDPQQAWGFWLGRAKLYASAAPDESYGHLLRCARGAPQGYFVVTSNIDRLFVRASFDESRLFEIHGSIFDVQCSSCDAPVRRYAPHEHLHAEVSVDPVQWLVSEPEQVPTCPACSATLRVSTELAVDGHWNNEITRSQKRNFKNFRSAISPSANLMVLEIGCGIAMSKLRDEATSMCRLRRLYQKGGVVQGFACHVRVNLKHWGFESSDPMNFSLPMGAAEFLKQLVDPDPQQ